VLDGKNLIFFPVSAGHAYDIHNGYTDEIARFLYAQPCETLAKTQERIKHARSLMFEKKRSTFAAYKPNNVFVGCVDLRHENLHPRPVFWVCKEQQRKGYGTEILNAILAYGRKHLTTDFLQLKVSKDDIASIALLKKAGAKETGARFVDVTNELGITGTLLLFRLLNKVTQ